MNVNKGVEEGVGEEEGEEEDVEVEVEVDVEVGLVGELGFPNAKLGLGILVAGMDCENPKPIFGAEIVLEVVGVVVVAVVVARGLPNKNPGFAGLLVVVVVVGVVVVVVVAGVVEVVEEEAGLPKEKPEFVGVPVLNGAAVAVGAAIFEKFGVVLAAVVGVAKVVEKPKVGLLAGFVGVSLVVVVDPDVVTAIGFVSENVGGGILLTVVVVAVVGGTVEVTGKEGF